MNPLYIYITQKFIRKKHLILLFCFLPLFVIAQVPETDIIQQQQLENAAQNAGEDADLTELEEQRNYLIQHPLDLNSATYEDLIESGLFNDLEAEALLIHIKKHGKLIRLEELQTIDQFNVLVLRSILPYLTAKAESDLMRRGIAEIWRKGNHQVMIRTQNVLEEQKGFTDPERPSDNRYLGDPLKLYTRYRFTFGNQVSIGVTGEKDAGEEFFKGTQKNGFDFYSYHLFLKDGRLKALAIGDYQLKYGQGLVMWSGLATGKTSDVINIKRNSVGIRPYTSVNEFSYLRGGAISYEFGKITVDAFYSNRKIDGSLTDSDTLTDELLITSFSEDGYHRTTSELDKKDAISNELIGGHLNYRKSNLEIGITSFYSKYGQALEKNSGLYNQFDVNGKEFYNTGLHYSYGIRNILLFGETARSGNNSYATINGLMMSLDPRAALSLSYRNYSKEFELLYNNAFRESDNANERGVYLGLSLTPIKSITWNSYIDIFQFPWLRYQVDGPSYGSEFLSQVSWAPDRKSVFYVRFRQQDKEQNFKGESTIDELVNARQRNIRFNGAYKISPSFTLQSRAELNLRKEGNASTTNGTVFFQDIQYNKLGSPFALSLRYAVFDTDNYDNRIYAFENDIPGVFSIPSYYYKGRRAYLMLRYKAGRGVNFWARYGTTIYDNDDTVGSGLDQISSNHKSDLKLQVRIDF